MQAQIQETITIETLEQWMTAIEELIIAGNNNEILQEILLVFNKTYNQYFQRCAEVELYKRDFFDHVQKLFKQGPCSMPKDIQPWKVSFNEL